MTLRRISLAVAVMALASLPAIETASGHYRTSRQWYFGGNTWRSDEGPRGDRSDPVNMLIYPNGGERSDFENHWTHHWLPRSFTHSELDRPLCRGDQWVGFKREREYRYLRTDFHWAGGNRCLTRYHFRVWGDGEHEQFTGTNHSFQDSWLVGGLHYERLNPPFGGPPGVGGHFAARDWDLVEFYTIHQRSKMRAHRGDYKWKELPFSKDDYQGHDSDGFISRVNGERHDDGSD